MTKFRSVILSVLIALTGCAHSGMRGTVAMKVSDDEAHVCLGSNEVSVGDRVRLIQNECTKVLDRTTSCKMTKIGEGEVTQVLNEHYSVIKIMDHVPFHEGTMVEKE